MDPRSIQGVFQTARLRLEEAGFEHPQLEVEILLAHVLDLDTRQFLLLDRSVPLVPLAANRFEGLLVRRLAREPLQYIVGSAQFCEFDFRVGPGVLIPRPETEVLVETVSRYITTDLGKTGRLVDVGTGSGVIAVSLLARYPGWIGMGLDLSRAALDYATTNAGSILGGQVGPGAINLPFLPVRSNLLSCVSRGLDLIVSNPPYIPSAEIEDLASEVRDREPRLALDGGLEGLQYTRTLVGEASTVLRQGGLLALELALGQPEAVRVEAEGLGFVHRETYRDLTGRERGLVLEKS